MREKAQLAQRSRTMTIAPSLSLGVAAETSGGPCVRLENPLGVPADRSVEARTTKPDEKRLHAAIHLGDSESEQLAKGAQENGLQHRCASSTPSLSPKASVFDRAEGK
jgi:hypothetical protein